MQTAGEKAASETREDVGRTDGSEHPPTIVETDDRHDFHVKNVTAITDHCPSAILRYPFSLRRWIFTRRVCSFNENVAIHA